MAKISARGCHAVYTATKEFRDAFGGRYQLRRVLRSDRKVLEASRVEWETLRSCMKRAENPDIPKEMEWLNWTGYTVKGTLKPELGYEEWHKIYLDKGWTIK